MTDLEEKRPLPKIPTPPSVVTRYYPNPEDSQEDSQVSPNTQNHSNNEEMPSQSFIGLIKGIVVANYKALPRRLLKDVIWIGPLLIVWVGLWVLSPMQLLYVPGPIKSIVMFLIFLTATYNGFIGKAAFVTVISRTFIPMFKRVRGGEIAEIKAKYRQTASIIKNAIVKSKTYAIKIFLISGGVGLIASNILTRNNKIDKYLVCVLCAVALFDDMSKGNGSQVVRLVSTGLRDLPIMFGQHLKVTMTTTYLVITGFAIGLLLALLPSLFFNSFTSPGGYIFGAIFCVAGVAFHFVGGKNANK
ncbi:MAG: hypothetical protein WCF96_06930 [Eubacteriales bacterium]